MANYIERDVIVVGAGPGGSIAASYLARDGVDVLLLDKETFPREKVCGDGFDSNGLIHLKSIGAYDEYLSYAEKHTGCDFYAADGTKVSIYHDLYTCPRRFSDMIIRNAAERMGAEVMEDCWAYDIIKEEGQVKGIKAKYQGQYIELRAKVVIACDGAHSKIAKAAGMYFDGIGDGLAIGVGHRGYMSGIEGLEDRWEFYFEDKMAPGYVWIMPHQKHEKGFANVGIYFPRGMYEGQYMLEMMEAWFKTPGQRDRFKNAKWTGPVKGWRLPQNYQLTGICENGLMIAGDAAAHNIPVSGEGISSAMCAATYTAMAAINALKVNDFTKEGGLKLYPDMVDKHMKKPYAEMRKMAELIQKKEDCNAFLKKAAGSEEIIKQFVDLFFEGGGMSDGLIDFVGVNMDEV